MTTDERPPAERLLAAAEELFGERSYGRTTVADICARAGMATGSFYAYFDSKSEIFAAVVRGINRDLRRAMAMAVEQANNNQRARERACFRAFFDMVSRRPWIDRIVRESEFVAPGLFREYYEQLARGYARGVRVAQLAGRSTPATTPRSSPTSTPASATSWGCAGPTGPRAAGSPMTCSRRARAVRPGGSARPSGTTHAIKIPRYPPAVPLAAGRLWPMPSLVARLQTMPRSPVQAPRARWLAGGSTPRGRESGRPDRVGPGTVRYD